MKLFQKLNRDYFFLIRVSFQKILKSLLKDTRHTSHLFLITILKYGPHLTLVIFLELNRFRGVFSKNLKAMLIFPTKRN